ncbi:MAG: zinc ribbon domain-containing protein [Oscillospiraceae bacterium]|nr:zinc ribbon domain-containing protein [Oscillospiraceae bacterium]
MKFCPNCGKKADDIHPFCSGCGYKFPAAAPSNNAYAYQTPPTQPPVKTKKSKTPLIIIIAVIAVLAIAAVLFFVTNIFGNHVIQATEFRRYYDGELLLKREREFDSNGDMTEQVNYYYDEYGDVWLKDVVTYEYDGKHNRTGYTIKSVRYDEYGDVEDTYEHEYNIEAYKENGLWYYEVYDEDGDLSWTEVYDKHRELVQELDEDGNITYKSEYKYDIFGRLISIKDKYYEDNICTEWTEREFEHDGGEMIDTYSDASDWDEDSSYYKGYEAVYEWHFYYFW